MEDSRPPTQRLLKRSTVEQMLDISRSTIYARLDPKSHLHDPHFPTPIKRGATSICWIESEIQAYIAYLIADSRKEGGEKRPGRVAVGKRVAEPVAA